MSGQLLPYPGIGDFNCRPESAERLRLLAAIDEATPPYKDAWELTHPGEPHPPTVGVFDKKQWPGPPFTFDFIFVSEDLAPRVQDLCARTRPAMPPTTRPFCSLWPESRNAIACLARAGHGQHGPAC